MTRRTGSFNYAPTASARDRRRWYWCCDRHFKGDSTMSNLIVKTSDGASTTLASEVLAAFRAGLRGPLCVMGEPGYDQARTIWNGMIDRRPAAIVRAAGAADVIRAVKFANKHRLLISIRGGGHNIAGNAVCDGGLMVDLTPMKSVRIESPEPDGARRAGSDAGRVRPGGAGIRPGHADRNQLDHRCRRAHAGRRVRLDQPQVRPHHRQSPLRGRRHGRRRPVRASDKDDADLFWAIRGGGGNFGVATSFEFRLHPVGPEVLAGLIVHPFSKAKELLEGYRRVVAGAPEELTCWVVMRKAPPLPFLPAEVHGKEVLIFALCYAGDLREGPQGRRADPGPRHAHRGRGRPQSLRRLADRVRSAAGARRPELLEVTRLRRAERRSDRGDARPRRPTPVSGLRGLHRQPGRRREPGARAGDRLPTPGRAVRDERPHALERRCGRQGLHRLGSAAVRRDRRPTRPEASTSTSCPRTNRSA